MLGFMLGRKDAAGAHRLGNTRLLDGLRAGELKIVESFLHERSYLPGEVVFDAGDEGQALYLILSGRIAICRPGEIDKPIARLGSGEFFGEMALLDDLPRSAQVRALEASQVAVLFRGDFERLMESHGRIASRIAMQLARHLGLRLRGTMQRQAAVEAEAS